MGKYIDEKYLNSFSLRPDLIKYQTNYDSLKWQKILPQFFFGNKIEIDLGNTYLLKNQFLKNN